MQLKNHRLEMPRKVSCPFDLLVIEGREVEGHVVPLEQKLDALEECEWPIRLDGWILVDPL